jgi:hypothetical protein
LKNATWGAYAFDIRSPALEDQHAALARADDVVLFDEADPEIVQQSPSFKLHAQVRPLVLNDPNFELVRQFPTAGRGLQYQYLCLDAPGLPEALP